VLGEEINTSIKVSNYINTLEFCLTKALFYLLGGRKYKENLPGQK